MYATNGPRDAVRKCPNTRPTPRRPLVSPKRHSSLLHTCMHEHDEGDRIIAQAVGLKSTRVCIQMYMDYKLIVVLTE